MLQNSLISIVWARLFLFFGNREAVYATIYVTDRAHIAPVVAELLPPLSAHPIPHTLFVVKGLAAPEILMEIDVHACLG